MPPRYALYYTPPPGSAFAHFGAGVLGYDCDAAAEVPHIRIDGIDPQDLTEATSEPRRYGFHGTIVAPFHLAARSEPDLIAAVSALADGIAPVDLGLLAPETIGHFIALTPVRAPAALAKLAADSLAACDECRAPQSAADRERRIKAGLTARQVELMDRWGYPYVLDQFRFHMTLTGALPAARRPIFHDALARAFARRAAEAVTVDAISILRQDDRAARFHVVRRCALGG